MVDAPTRGARGPYALRLSVRLDAPALAIAVDERRGLVACALANGWVALLDVSTGALIDSWEAHARSRARSVALAHDAVWSGGADGTVRRRHLKPSALAPEGGKAALDNERELETLTPPHGAAVVALAGRADGLLISAAHDGTVRVWDVAPRGGGPVRCLYGLVGYKVWLGSVVTDGTRLVSDGSDNVVIVHDFSRGVSEAEEEDGESDMDPLSGLGDDDDDDFDDDELDDRRM